MTAHSANQKSDTEMKKDIDSTHLMCIMGMVTSPEQDNCQGKKEATNAQFLRPNHDPRPSF